MKSRSGFTLVEVMITIVVLFVVIDSMMLFFLNVMAEYRRQSKITETGIETLIGLEVLRKDAESAGYALPWGNLPAYAEAAAGVSTVSLNDPSSAAPRAVVNGVGMGFDNSDVLVIKSVSVGTDEACKRWTTLQEGDAKRIWSDNSFNFTNNNQVLVLGTDTDPSIQRRFIAVTAYNNTAGSAPTAPDIRVIHGLTDSISPPRMPFNRADYFIETDNVPRLCAPGTGVLVKSVIRQDTGGRGPSLPLLDCVKDMQVAFGLNELGTGPAVDCVVATPADNTAAYLRTRLREIRISILSHEGAADRQYQYPDASIFVGDTSGPVGRDVDVSGVRNYRWKLHNIVVRPSSLR